MVFKYTFSISGDDLYPEKVLDKIQGDFIAVSHFSPTDKKKFGDKNSEYGYGGISFWHPNKFATEDRIMDYEKAFVEFIENNYGLFFQNGGNDLDIYLEIYYDGGQCNFEVFNKEMLSKLAKLGVSLPISIYILEENQLQEWENEISLLW
jgi:hypothetical protein